MTNDTKPTIGIIGAGRLGTAVARQALKANYKVTIANSKPPETLRLISSILFPEAKAATINDVIKTSDIIVLAMPINQYKTLPASLFNQKIVIDAMNYWPTTEGTIPEFETKNSSSSEYIQHYLPSATVVKTLNHVAYHELEEQSLLEGTPHRRAIGLAGNNKEAKLRVAQFISDLGFDPVDLGKLDEGRKLEPDTKLFNARYTADEIRSIQ